MGTVDERGAAVRIELGGDDGAIVPPPMDSVGAGGAGGRTIGVVLVGVLLVGALVWSTRPDDGETAAGTPITVPTTIADDTEASDGSEVPGATPSTTTSEGATSDARDEFEDYASVPAEQSFLLSIVQADLGWVALGLGVSGGAVAGNLLRSVDGLRWSPIAEGSLPDGDLMGLDRIDGVYIVAVDEAASWSTDGSAGQNGRLPDHRISVWTSSDAVKWTPSDLPVLEGNGFPYFVSFTEDAYVVPMVVAPEVPGRYLVELLAPFVDAETAATVCSSKRTFETEIRSVELRSCDGRLVAELTEAEFPADFERVWPLHCVDVARSLSDQNYATMFVERDAPPVRAEITDTESLFGQAVPEGVLQLEQRFGERGLPTECGGTDADDGPRLLGARLTYWSSATGERDVMPDGLENAGGALGFGRNIVRGPDDRYYFALGGVVWAGSAPFDDWELVLNLPAEVLASSQLNQAHLSLSGDGGHALLASPGNLWVAPLDGEWTHVDFDDSYGFVEIVVATDKYVVVRVQGATGQRHVQVPLV